ncbi:MAG: hypothetical protein JSV35_02000 [Candidatus Bathyarchaeota archaeon]|nr:MAG: hypothetical protein JSV35_02000 [Candidatus Bathyarchaeota archaeon]
MTPKDRKKRDKMSVKTEEVPKITFELDSSETEDELKEAKMKEESVEVEEKTTRADEKIRKNAEGIMKNNDVIGYILRNSATANIDLKDPSKIIDYAVLSSLTLEAGDKISEIFDLGSVKHVLIKGEESKLISFSIEDNKVTAFMKKGADHKRIFRDFQG